MNVEKNNLMYKAQPVTHSDFDKLARSVSIALRGDVGKILNEFSFKIKIESSIDLSKVFNTQVNQISKSFESFAKKAPLTLPFYLQSINERAKDFQEMLGYIKSYPLKSVTSQLKGIYKEEGINPYYSNSFIKEISKSITNLVVEYSINFDEIVVDKLCDRELLRLNPSFYIKNQALQILNPHKYNQYKQLLYKGIKAYYSDFKEYVNVESNCFKVIEKFFLKLMHKMEILDDQFGLMIAQGQQTAPISQPSINYPTHIFKNQEAFLLFTEYAEAADKPEDIGFAFRQMSEVEVPQLIMAKETVFRKWFNRESGHQLELNSAIKTLDRMGNTKLKENLYRLIKEKHNPEGGDKNKAA